MSNGEGGESHDIPDTIHWTIHPSNEPLLLGEDNHSPTMTFDRPVQVGVDLNNRFILVLPEKGVTNIKTQNGGLLIAPGGGILYGEGSNEVDDQTLKNLRTEINRLENAPNN